MKFKNYKDFDLTEQVGLYQFNQKEKMQTIKKVIAWLVLSSKDPNRVALTMKGLLSGVVVYIVWGGGLFGLNLDPSQLGDFFEVLSKIVQLALTLFSVLGTGWGLLRKIWTTAKGTNAVLNEY